MRLTGCIGNVGTGSEMGIKDQIYCPLATSSTFVSLQNKLRGFRVPPQHREMLFT